MTDRIIEHVKAELGVTMENPTRDRLMGTMGPILDKLALAYALKKAEVVMDVAGDVIAYYHGVQRLAFIAEQKGIIVDDDP